MVFKKKNPVFHGSFNISNLCFTFQKYLIRIESSLSKSSFDYTLPEMLFLANQSYKHFTFNFEPKACICKGFSTLKSKHIMIMFREYFSCWNLF